MAVRFKRSYHDRKEAIARRKRTVLKILIVCFSFQVIFSVFLSTIRVESVSMKPGIDKGDILVFAPFFYGFNVNILHTRLPQVRPPERGDIVVFTPPYTEKSHGTIGFFNGIVKFLTFNKVNLDFVLYDKQSRRYLIKRVIAVPGDTVKMSDFKASIKPEGSGYFLSEFEVIPQDYDINVEGLPSGWDMEMPFSGNMDPVVLMENQYFLLGDNRMMSSDSLNWGPLDLEKIEGKVIFSYWPFSRFRPVF